MLSPYERRVAEYAYTYIRRCTHKKQNQKAKQEFKENNNLEEKKGVEKREKQKGGVGKKEGKRGEGRG